MLVKPAVTTTSCTTSTRTATTTREVARRRGHRRMGGTRHSPVLPAVQVALQAVLAGGVLLNVLNQELPAERRSRYSAFIGAGWCTRTFLLVF